MEVSLAAQRPAVHADRRRCTWMYETRNETADRVYSSSPRGSWSSDVIAQAVDAPARMINS
jgi:hypothetical protein